MEFYPMGIWDRAADESYVWHINGYISCTAPQTSVEQADEG